MNGEEVKIISEDPRMDLANLDPEGSQEDGSGRSLPRITAYNPDIDSLDDLTRVVKDCYQLSKQFFGEDVEGIGVKMLYTREEMDKALGYKTQSWVVGSAGRRKTIVIFSPAVFSKVSPHPTSDFEPVLTHEIAHVFTSELFQFRYPRWLSEGLSGYVAEQYKTRPFNPQLIQDFDKIFTNAGWNKTNPYNQAYSFTVYLIERFGKENMLVLLQSLSPNDSLQDFTSKFLDAYKCVFDICQTDWVKNLETK